MSDELDKKLHRALRPIDPGADFTARVMERARANPRDLRMRRWRMAWIPATVAASAVLIVVGIHESHRRQEQAGRAASRQVLEALRVTSEKLDLAYRLVNKPPASRPDSGNGSGA